METPPLPPKKKGSSAEKIVLVTVMVVWVSTGLAGLGLLARSVFASGEGRDRYFSEDPAVLSSPSEVDNTKSADRKSQIEINPQDIAQREAAIQPLAQEASNEPNQIAARVQPTPESTSEQNSLPDSLGSARAQADTAALSIDTIPTNTPTPHTLDQASVCTLSEQACIDLCPDGSAFDDGMDFGGTAEWEVCEQACRFGKIRCIKGIEEDPCGHFHGACRYHCHEESYTEECEDSCDEGRDTCAKILAPQK